MEYRYELHCHTGDVSLCADVPAEKIVEIYKKAGYNGVVITDHFSPMTFEAKGLFRHDDMIDHYISGYRKALECAGDGFTVLLGIELRYHLTANDFLVFGASEEFLRNNKHLMIKYPRRFYKLAKKNGLIVVQAHPFREWMVRINPKYLDGVEVYNGKQHTDDERVKALEWADKHGMKIRTSGSDFHHERNFPNGGIVTDEPIKTNDDLLRILKNGQYRLIQEENNIHFP